MSNALPDPSQLLAQAVAEERATETMSAARRERLLAAIEAALPGLPDPPGGSDPQGGEPGDPPPALPGGGSAPSPHGSESHGAPDLVGGSSAAGSVSGGLTLLKVAAIFVAGLGIGGAVGAGWARSGGQPTTAPPERERIVVAPEPAEAPIVAPPELPIERPPRPVEATAQDAVAPAPTVRVDTPRRSTLGAERAVIDAARTSLARGNAANTVAALDRHEARYPNGELREERDGLRVLALARTDPARAREAAARFRRRYPSSVLQSAIDRALRELE